MHRITSLNRILAGLVASLAFSCAALAQTTSPDSVGLSSERLERVATVMQEQIDADVFSGSVTLIARDGQIAYLRAQGLMDIETKRPMQTDAVFRIMSMTKPIVAFSILMLAEDGKLRLTDPIGRFIPELKGLPVAAEGNAPPAAASRDITIRDLLTHSSGLMSGGASNAAGFRVESGEAFVDVLPRLRQIPLDFEPGSQWAYSPELGFDVLARVVEIASGIPFDQFAKEHIFEPLGMNDTYFYPSAGHPNLTTLYQSIDGKLVEATHIDAVNGKYISGGGGLNSTAEDYFKFAQMLLDGGKLGDTRLVSRKTVEVMASPLLPASTPGRTAGEAYGAGVRVVTDSAARGTWLTAGSFGWSGAFNTHFFIDPKERLVAIFMTQSKLLETRQQLREDFETAVMQALVD